MNFTTNRVQPEQIGEEPTDYSGFTSASIEDEEGTGLFIWVALAIWSVLMFACGWTARYFF